MEKMEDSLPLKKDAESLYENVPPIITDEGQKTRQYFAAIACTIGAFSIGTVLSWTSPALPYLSSNASCLNKPLSPEAESWVSSLIAIGAIVGSLPTGYIADAFGRKNTIIGLAIPFIISWVLLIFGRNEWFLYVARVLAGFACGGFSVVTPMYIGEIAEVSVRGALGSYFEVLLCIGIMFVYLIGAAVNYIWLNIIMCIPPILLVAIFVFMPDTPVYYLKKGRRSEAYRTLQYFRGAKYDIKPEMRMLEMELQEASRNAGTWKDLFCNRANINAVVISLGLMFFQQMTGVNILIFYTEAMFKESGASLAPEICAVIIGIVQAIVTYISLLIVDKLGRRLLLFISSVTSFTCLTTLGTFFYLKHFHTACVENLSWIPLVIVTIFIVGMAIGFGPVPWLVMGEIFSSQIKGPASSIACITNWGLVFFVTRTYIYFEQYLGNYGTFWFYAGVTFLGFLFIWFRVPETKGKTFLQIQGLLLKL